MDRRSGPALMYVEARKRLVAWLRRQLIGPAGEGRLGTSPLDRYPTGVLHPVDPPVSGIDPASAGGGESEPALVDDEEDTTPADGESEERSFARPARRRRYVPPSSVGFSCFVRGEVRLAITCSAAVYGGAEQQDEAEAGRFQDRDEAGRFLPGEYARTPLPERTVTWSSATAFGGSGGALWEGRAGVDVRARPHRDGLIVTVTLCNREELDPDVPPRLKTRDRVAKSLFETELSCVVEGGELVDYPRVDPSLLTEEEQELELQYREQRIYALGHGAAASWDVRPGREARDPVRLHARGGSADDDRGHRRRRRGAPSFTPRRSADGRRAGATCRRRCADGRRAGAIRRRRCADGRRAGAICRCVDADGPEQLRRRRCG